MVTMLDIDRRRELRSGLAFTRIMTVLGVFAFALGNTLLMEVALAINAAVWLLWGYSMRVSLDQLALADKDDPGAS